MKRAVLLLSISVLATVILIFARQAEAQQPAKNVPVIGMLHPGSPSVYAPQHEAFEQGLRELGYVVGQSILIEYRYDVNRQPELVAELVGLKVDVIVVIGTRPTKVVNETTNTIPIVVASAGDLIGAGLVASLAKPGGNITGSTNIDADFSAKRLELLKEAFPKLSRVAFYSWEGNRGDQAELRETLAAAQPLGVRIQSLEIKNPSQIPDAFAAMTKQRAEALIITNNAFNFRHLRPVLELAAKNRLPTMCGRSQFVANGCLISYAASRLDSFRRAAYFVDKILKGAKPADLPVERPTKFELVINLKTAKALGLTIPPEVLFRADKVIK